MKLYGYAAGKAHAGDLAPSALAEVTLLATPAELRKIAAFLNAAAARMEVMGREYSHEHLSDNVRGFKRSPHFVVAAPVL